MRKLNIHEHEIGTQLADEIKGLETVAGAGCAIAMRLQQIAKELHIQLVVLHDQDGFRHPVLQSPGDRPGMRCKGAAAGRVKK